MSDNILLSEKHGLNPSLMQCFLCGRDFGIALFGKMKDRPERGPMGQYTEHDPQAPHRICDGSICNECQEIREKGGIFLIEIDEAKSEDMQNPYRAGPMCAMTAEAIRKIFEPEVVEDVLKAGLAWVEQGMLAKLGIPMEEDEKGAFDF